MNIKCRKAGSPPDAVVIVATGARALKMNGGCRKNPNWGRECGRFAAAVQTWAAISAIFKSFGRPLPVVVAINHFAGAIPRPKFRPCADYVAEQGGERCCANTGAMRVRGSKILPKVVKRWQESGAGAICNPCYPDDICP